METLIIRLETIDVKTFLNDYKPLDNIYEEIIKIFNYNFKIWIFNTLIEKLIKSNISSTILLDEVEIFTHKIN